MITVAIVAILAAIAYPNYRNYVLRSQLVDATNGLSALQANMERYFQDNRRYDDTGGFLSPCDAPASIGSFNFACALGPAPSMTFVLTATGSASTTGFVFTVDNTNVKSTTATASGWTPSCPTWETKAGQC